MDRYKAWINFLFGMIAQVMSLSGLFFHSKMTRMIQ
jgi:hypothetical protein